MQRPLIKQEATTFSFSVTTAAQSPAQNIGLASLIDSFLITVPSTAANSIFLGFDQGVTTTSGIELLAGTTVEFRIDHGGRQMYELQNPENSIRDNLTCKTGIYDWIPFVCWDMSSVFLVATAPTTISMALFKAVYI